MRIHTYLKIHYNFLFYMHTQTKPDEVSAINKYYYTQLQAIVSGSLVISYALYLCIRQWVGE